MTDLPNQQAFSNHPPLNDADLDLLSAYLDDALSPAELATLHQRLQQEPELHAALHELQFMQQMLQALPTVPTPRSFTLDPETVAVRSIPLTVSPARWKSNLMLRLGGALTGLVVVLLMVGSMVTLLGRQPQVAQVSAPSESASGVGATDSAREADASSYSELDELGGVAGSTGLTGDGQSLPPSPGVFVTIETDEAEPAPANSPAPQAVPTTFGDLAASDTSSPSTNTADVQPLAVAPAPVPALWLPLGLVVILIVVGGAVLWWVRRRE